MSHLFDNVIKAVRAGVSQGDLCVDRRLSNNSEDILSEGTALIVAPGLIIDIIAGSFFEYTSGCT